MSQKLHSQAVAARDELHLLIRLHSLQEIALEQLERAKLSPEHRRAIPGLLITCYLYQVLPCLESIEAELGEIRLSTNSRNNFLEVRNHG